MMIWNQTTVDPIDGFKPDSEVDIIELAGFETYRLDSQPQVIKVLLGCAWITVRGQDMFVPRGEETLLTPGRERPIISSPNSRPLVFEVHSGS